MDQPNDHQEAQLGVDGKRNIQQVRGIDDIDTDTHDVDVYENESVTSSSTPLQQHEGEKSSLDVQQRPNQTLTYEAATQYRDDDDDDSDENDDESKGDAKKKSFFAVGATAVAALGMVGYGVAKIILEDDDDTNDHGAFHTHDNGSGATSTQGDPTSSAQATPDFSQTAQMASAPPPATAVAPMIPAELQLLQHMARQAASNAAGTAGSVASAAAGAAAAGAAVATSYVTLSIVRIRRKNDKLAHCFLFLIAELL